MLSRKNHVEGEKRRETKPILHNGWKYINREKRQGVKIVEGGLRNGSKLTCLSALMFPIRIYRSRVSNCINEIGSIHTDGWDFVEWNRPSVYRQSFAKYKSPEKNIPHQLRVE